MIVNNLYSSKPIRLIKNRKDPAKSKVSTRSDEPRGSYLSIGQDLMLAPAAGRDVPPPDALVALLLLRAPRVLLGVHDVSLSGERHCSEVELVARIHSDGDLYDIGRVLQGLHAADIDFVAVDLRPAAIQFEVEYFREHE